MTTTPATTSDVGVLGTCSACGSGPAALNFTCERCRFVYALMLMRDMRAAQVDYFHDRSQHNLIAAKNLESKMDKVLDRLLVPPTAQQPDLDMQVERGDDYYASGS